jgi:hypothetical protein
MRFLLTAAGLLAASLLSACHTGPDGNPDNQPYATEPGGAIAVKPQFISTESYDPYGKPAPFADMQSGSVAINPSATPPMNLTPQGASPMPNPMVPGVRQRH